jgi:O-antigen/teichoic acid export membrane protein
VDLSRKDAALTEKSLGRLVLDGVVWLTAVRVITQVISWTITIYVIRILTSSDYGLWAMAWVYIGLIGVLNEIGLGAAIIQRKDLSQDELSSIYWAVLSINLALYVFTFLSAPLVAEFYHEPRVADILRVASITFIISALSLVPSNILTRELAFSKQSQAELIAYAAGPVATLWLATEGFGVWSLVYGSLVTETVRGLLCFVFRPWTPNASFSFSKVKVFVQFGAKVAAARLLWYLSANIDFLIAGKILGKTQLGYYAVAVQLASIPLDKLVSTVAYVAFPAFSKMQDDPSMLRRYYLKIVNVVAFVSFPACFGIYLVAESAVPLFLSEKWLPAVLPLQILSMVTACRTIHTINAPLAVAVGRPGITLLNVAIVGSVMALCFLVGSSYGLEGLAYAWLAFPAVFLITTWITVRVIGLSLADYLKGLTHPFLGTGFMVLAVLMGQRLALEGLGLVSHVAGSVVVGLASYVVYYVLFNRHMFTEVRSVLRR